MVLSKRNVKQIAIEIWDLSSETVDLEGFCERKLRELNPEIGELEVADEIDGILSEVTHQLNKKIDSFKEKGIPPNFEFDDYVPKILRRCSSNNGNNDWLRFVRRWRNEIKAAIKNMDPITFEHFCRHILQINGIVSFVTKPSRDGGVDFYGLLEMRNYTQKVFLSSVKLRVLGQAKHHSGEDKVGGATIDEIRTKYDDFNRGQGRAVDILPCWFTVLSLPIMAMVATNTDFTSGARQSAERDNIILRDGDQITEDIIHSPKSKQWFHTNIDGNKIFEQQLFLESFKEQ